MLEDGKSSAHGQNDAIDPSVTSADDLGVHAGLRTSEDDYDGSDAFACP